MSEQKNNSSVIYFSKTISLGQVSPKNELKKLEKSFNDHVTVM